MTGPDGNLGDIVIRRAVLDWVRTPNGVVAFVGNHPASWLNAMQFSAQDQRVSGDGRQRMAWLIRGAFGPGKPVLVTDPGEAWVGRNRFPHHLFHLLVGLVIKLRGGAIVIPPHAFAQQKAAPKSAITSQLHRLFARIADLCYWREPRSLDVARTGELVPDIAFSLDPGPSISVDDRDFIVVSLRGDRPSPSQASLDAISAVASAKNLKMVFVSQVDCDVDRARSLADSLDADCVVWDPEDARSEAKVRHVYDRAALVISDRLHVLILGLLAGAMPVEVACSPERKIAAHFSTIGLHDISLDVQGHSVEEIAEWLRAQAKRRVEAVVAMESAHASVERAGNRVRALLEGIH